MAISYWCIILAALLPYVFIIIAKSKKGYLSQNNAPRVFLANLSGFRQRAHWASQNSFEAFPIFAAAVLSAHLIGHINIDTLNLLSTLFIVFRVIYGIFYLLNLATLRSLAWMVAVIMNLMIFLIPLI